MISKSTFKTCSRCSDSIPRISAKLGDAILCMPCLDDYESYMRKAQNEWMSNLDGSYSRPGSKPVGPKVLPVVAAED